ncbi:enoyl-CoA hydratase [Rhodococcus sp. PAMC28707]|uniref:enoyl-CoA hydratase-related protein n=1 Tax=unclassified Rhodococcus (in: high G+C Gram-positive bacteria) TaxID=192944 RepID=UPI00109DFA86|nr:MULTISPECIES: enoyl-CoA hydratase-related protein [unclassified Rhodococcus (in: high G+C Gram-positive bacteria)]QCB49668.1 enoyl-CoA hydratase [Rhodococcus sp. PAMC28705]QCB58641.1 enoyl-CoA hydratase [Rhodococcus sp. PAMC28707]
MTEVVLTETRGHTMLVTINRPAAANSINADVHRGLGEAWELAQATDEIRVVVLTGAGEATFCAGADLKALGTSGPDGVTPPDTAHWGFAGVVKHHITKPIIAAVNGNALGGGTELALASDLVVAADTSTFGLPEVKRGLIAGAGGVFRLVTAIPRAVALELLLTGNALSAEDALRWGLVNRVVPQAEVLTTALALAETIAGGAPLAVQASKTVARGIVDGVVPSEAEGWALTEQALARLSTSADTMEGIMAFLEKRDPIWSGK